MDAIAEFHDSPTVTGLSDRENAVAGAGVG
jgi:hypothetical protein